MSTAAKANGNAPIARQGSRRRILVADDNRDMREILEHVLAALDCDVFLARDGEQALSLWARAQPDLAILDVMMPKMDGFELCRRIKEQSRDQFVPVLLLTALDRASNAVTGLDAGADAFVTKPFDPDELVARVKALLRIKALQDQLAISQSELSESNRVLDVRVREQVLELVKLSRLRRLLPPAVVDTVLAAGDDPTTRQPRRKDVSVVFCDVRSFTSIADQLDPEDVTDVLGEYLEEMSDAVFEHGGIVNKFMGDGVFAMFNDPIEQADHVERAVKTGLEMSARAKRLEGRLHTRLPEPFSIGIGVHTGPAVVGPIGRGKVLDYTAVGSTVNLAARVQALASGNAVLVTEPVLKAMKDRLVVTMARRETLKGFAHPVRIAEVTGLR